MIAFALLGLVGVAMIVIVVIDEVRRRQRGGRQYVLPPTWSPDQAHRIDRPR